MADKSSRLWMSNNDVNIKLIDLGDNTHALATTPINNVVVIKERMNTAEEIVIAAGASFVYTSPTDFSSQNSLFREFRTTVRVLDNRNIKLEVRFYSNAISPMTGWIEIHTNDILAWGFYPMISTRAELRVTNLSTSPTKLGTFQVLGIK